MKLFNVTLASTLLLLAFNAQVHADQHVLVLTDHGKNTLSKWLGSPIVVDKVKAQNSRTKDMSEAEIIVLDKQWRAEVDASNQPLIEEVMKRSLSTYLKQIKDKSKGLYTEIFVMDARGINVGQSDVTSDYWQGDEAKWQETYLRGADAIHVGDVDLDESSQQFQSQLSMSVVDPVSGTVIGAITVGVNLDEL